MPAKCHARRLSALDDRRRDAFNEALRTGNERQSKRDNNAEKVSHGGVWLRKSSRRFTRKGADQNAINLSLSAISALIRGSSCFRVGNRESQAGGTTHSYGTLGLS